PADYLAREEPLAVARHAVLAASLGPARRARVSVTPRAAGTFDVAVVAFDYLAELSIVCGLLAAHGLDIEEGHAHTLEPETEADDASSRAPGEPDRARRRRSAPRRARRIVDVFRVRPRDGHPPEGEALERELVPLLDQVAEGRSLEARESIHLRLVEAIEKSAPAPADDTLTIRFDNATDPHWTVLEVEGRDTPAFLYALTNALAMRGLYIHDVRIAGAGGLARDRFRIARAGGGRIEDAAEQQLLRTTIALIQQFTLLLPGTPDPARALRYFDQFMDRIRDLPDEALVPFANPEGLRDLARLLGSSAFLWEDVLRYRFAQLLPGLARWRTRPLRSRHALANDLRGRLADAPPEGRAVALREFRDEQALAVEVRRVLDPGLDLVGFSTALAELGDALVEELTRAVVDDLAAQHGRPRDPAGHEVPLAVLGLGKFGGREMGYASDLELLFAYGGEGRTERTGREAGLFFDEVVRRAQAWLEAPEGSLFHLDLRLRPHGGKGPLAVPLQALRDYYRPGGGASPFERQALVKLRFVAGDAALGEAVAKVRDDFVWSGEPWDREDALRLRQRQAHELVPPGRFNVKLSPGGLVDAEYAVQYLQIVHGREHPSLRTPSTLLALDRLLAAGRLSAVEHHQLQEGYLFWRRVADALRIVRGHADDLLLPDEGSDALGFLARRLGYPGGRAEAAALLDADVDRHRLQL
ncbi:MAG TPA: hypothetical protein VI589_07250, partial [Vicinamibacteria bacterium]